MPVIDTDAKGLVEENIPPQILPTVAVDFAITDPPRQAIDVWIAMSWIETFGISFYPTQFDQILPESFEVFLQTHLVKQLRSERSHLSRW
jgi:hypothetical protein